MINNLCKSAVWACYRYLVTRESMLLDLNQRITTLTSELEIYATHAGFLWMDRAYTCKMIHLEKEVLDKKIHKLHRDRHDYESGYIQFCHSSDFREENKTMKAN